MPTLFRKTTKGQTEIETRAHRLVPRLRALLILVDGKRDAAALTALVPQADGLLTELLTQGFVEALPEAEAPSPSPSPSSSPRPAAPAAKASATPPAPATSKPAAAAKVSSAAGTDFDTLRRHAVRALNDELGPAAETIAIRIEGARSMAELRPLLVQAAQAVANMRGRGAAEAYAAKFLAEE